MEKKPMGKKTIEKKSIEKKTKDKELADNVPSDRKTGKVSLVGAGCGGPELLTLKGLNCLRQCDAVLYDSLAAQELLELTPVGCEKINVGKRYGGKAMPQEDINALLVEKAREGNMWCGSRAAILMYLEEAERKCWFSRMRGSHVRRYQVLHPRLLLLQQREFLLRTGSAAGW